MLFDFGHAFANFILCLLALRFIQTMIPKNNPWGNAVAFLAH
jgi:hypothetical protein